jgi:outer membrane protein OmpA-like peptidoglycan-associated protein
MFPAAEAQAAGAGQWRLPDGGGAVCSTLLLEAPAEGARITSTLQPLQVAIGLNEVVRADASGGGISIGDRFEVVRNNGSLEHPVTEAEAGHVVEVLGMVEVVDVNDHAALIKVVGACREMEIGDVLLPVPDAIMTEDLPRLPVFNSHVLVTADEADAFVVLGSLESVASEAEPMQRDEAVGYELYAQRDLIVIDQGSNDQWELADMAMIYRDRVFADSDVFRDAMAEPPVIGRGVVVRADATSAVLQVTDAVSEMQIGDRARKTGSALMYVNHPPSLTCRSERMQVRTGESVRLTADATDPDDDDTVVTWVASAGELSSDSGNVVTWTASGLDDGAVNVTATADDGRDGFDDCQVVLNVGPVPAGGGRVVEGAGGGEVIEFTCPEFPSGNTVIDNRCKALLDDVALRLRQDPRGTAEIVGHSDTSGSADVNDAMSQERADNARDYLVETHGIDASRLQASGVGSSDPIADNGTAEGQLRNRRVVIRVVLSGQDQ